MNSEYPDAYPGETDEEYIARTRKESKSATGLMFSLASLFLFFLKMAAIFGVFIYAGYLLSQKMLGEETDKFKIWGITLLFTYLIFCVIFFLKGIVIGLRDKNRKLWVLPWVICVFLCCIIPAFLIKSAFGIMFNPVQQQQAWYTVISWIVFILSLLYIYGIYQFKTPNSPCIFNWIFRLGIKVGRLAIL